MDNFSDDFYGQRDLSTLVTRFEDMVQRGISKYYEVDDLESLLDHYMMHHRLELAFKVIETVHEQHPQNKQLTLKEAELLSLAEKHNEALDLLSEIEVLEGFNPEFHMTKATILSQSGNYEKAIRCLHQALECSNDEADIIYMNLAIEHQNLDQHDKAVEYLQQALDINPDNEDALYELAYCFELTRKFEDAVTFFTKLIDRRPYNAHAWFNLGAAHQALGNFEKALTSFDYVNIIDEEFHAAYFNKANVLVRMERHQEAIDLYKKALAFDILDSLIYFYIGDCYDHTGDAKSALVYFEKAIKKDEAMAEAWIGASSALDQLDRELEALEYAKKAILLDPENGDYHCFLAGLQMKYDLLIESCNSFENAIKFGYTHDDLWEDYVQLAFALRNYEDAKSIVERGLEEHPDNPRLITYQCVCLYHLDAEDEAFEKLVEVLIQDASLLEEFLIYYPKAAQHKDVQFLIEALNQNQ